MVSWNKKRVLVTGAGGFIGSHLTERLVEEGAEVRTLVHYNAIRRWGWLDRSKYAKQIEIISGDVTDQDCMRQAVKNREIIFHLGALIAISYSYQVPLSYARTNIEGTINLLQSARDKGIHTSNSEAYGTAQSSHSYKSWMAQWFRNHWRICVHF